MVKLLAHPDCGVHDKEAHGADNQEIHEPVGVKQEAKVFRVPKPRLWVHGPRRWQRRRWSPRGTWSTRKRGGGRGSERSSNGRWRQWLTPVALAAGEVAPGSVERPSLLRVAFPPQVRIW